MPRRWLALLGVCSATLAWAGGGSPGERFREANETARHGDYPKAIEQYARLADDGARSGSLYWNWAQAAAARGASGEALWALMQAREYEMGDPAIARGVERLRTGLNLDPAELNPEPLAVLRRWSHGLHLALAAVALLVVSLVAHAIGRWRGARFGAGVSWASLTLGTLLVAVCLLAASARSVGVVIRRGAPLLDAASPTAEVSGSLREGEVLPILETSGDYVRVQDSSGARGWAHVADVRRVADPEEAREGHR